MKKSWKCPHCHWINSAGERTCGRWVWVGGIHGSYRARCGRRRDGKTH